VSIGGHKKVINDFSSILSILSLSFLDRRV
jgi:hypothetical protein